MLTERQIRALKPAEKEYTVSDGRSARGEGVLMLRVRPNGTKEFYFQRRKNGRKLKTKLGTWPAMALTEARDRCREEKEIQVEAGTFKELMAAYVAKLKQEGRRVPSTSSGPSNTTFPSRSQPWWSAQRC